MGSIKVNIENVSEKIKGSVDSIIKRSGFRKQEVEIRRIDTNKGNFLGRLYEVNIKGVTDTGEKELNIFFKEELVIEKIKLVDVKEAYSKEIFIYKHFAKIANELQEEVKVPESERYRFTNAYDETTDGLIILENLSMRGFKTYFKMDVMPIEYAEISIKNLARFHALSFAIENKMPIFFEREIKSLSKSFNMDDDFHTFLRNISETTANMLDEDDKQKLLKFKPVLTNKFSKYFVNEGKFKCCMNHGDYRINNVLVREEEGVPKEVMAVDYQLIDYGYILRDFMFFIFTGTDREFRHKHLNNLKNMYFETMKTFLRYFDLDIDDIYSRDTFDEEYKAMLDLGLMIGLYCSIFVFSAEDSDFSLESKSLTELDVGNLDRRYTPRLKGLVDDFIEWGILGI
ncbi:uncharacterized protein LOC121739420 [Aricia agestis]|uniref:uncharacterized protein LOC121739420 n=1 Tax=Aricia agestis TaxID=91739 RepID=UPI001C201732|nr:uncharacterized protein LOC121739420 [Aricia agestis]